MFLIDNGEKAVLYTGDVRCTVIALAAQALADLNQPNRGG